MTNALLRYFATRPRPLITDEREIARRYRRCRTSVICSITLGYGFLYTCRLGLSVVKKPLLDAGLFTATELGQIGSAMFYTYAVGKLVNGFLADHADVRRAFAASVACSAAVNLAMGVAPHFWVWVLLWGMNGWFQGFGAPACAVSLTNWFTARERGRYYGIWSLAHSLGEGMTFVVSALLVTRFGWRGAFVGPGLFCLLVAYLLLVFLKDRPASQGLPDLAAMEGTSAETESTGGSVVMSQLSLLRRPALWVLGLSSASMYVSRYAINNWGILFLQETKSMSLTQASSMLALNNLTGMAGAVVYGYCSDTIFAARRPPATLLFGVFECLALAGILYLPPSHPILLAAAFGLFGFTLSGLLAVLGGLFAIDLVPKQATGAVMGLIGAFSYLGAAMQDTLTGHLLDLHKTVAADGVTHYDFALPAYFWLGSSVLSLVLASSLWRAKPRA